MKITYDSEVDILSIDFTEATIEESIEDKQGVIIDYDIQGNIVAIEILDASKQMPIPPVLEYSLISQS